jgi:uncharacterized protein (DUF885 family)
MRILELRDRAEKRLGKDFDVRDFHDQVLSSGALPLELLESNLETWIESREALSSVVSN